MSISEFSNSNFFLLQLSVTACDGEFENYQQCTNKDVAVRMKVSTPYEPEFAESQWKTSFTGKSGIYDYRSNITRG
jgi:hypothetical protein